MNVEIKEQEMIMPDIIGIDLTKSLSFLNKIGLTVEKIVYEESEYKNNTVIKQSIKPWEKIEKGNKIHLTISNINPIKYLPSIYQAFDKKNGDFLKRYLWIFQHILNSINIKLDNIHEYFNPMEAPTGFFQWLASWFSININYAIPEDKMRLLVKEAVNLYQWRGTAKGIAKFLEIITGVKPDIIEGYIPIREYFIVDDKLVERPIIDERTSPYQFTVYFPVSSNYFDIETIKKINQIIKSEKPAHTSYYIVFLKEKVKKEKPSFIIGEDIIDKKI